MDSIALGASGWRSTAIAPRSHGNDYRQAELGTELKTDREQNIYLAHSSRFDVSHPRLTSQNYPFCYLAHFVRGENAGYGSQFALRREFGPLGCKFVFPLRILIKDWAFQASK
jgi:hypothetical protein